MRKTNVSAHRGLSAGMLENTRSAFAKAISIGVDEIEFDVHLSKDGEVIVIHDETLDRTTTGTGEVRNYTLDELKKFRIKDEQGTPTLETVPTLDEVLDLIKQGGTHVKVNIELKTDVFQYEGLVKKVIQKIEGHQLPKEPFLFSSFHHDTLKEVPEGYQRGLLYYDHNQPNDPWISANQYGATSIHFDQQTLTKDLVRECHKRKLQVRAYTVNDENVMKDCLDWGVDGIITNFPEKVMELRRAKNQDFDIIRLNGNDRDR
ncbi:glycerophosphoryl diester phosphodiesterase [Seinonella peptonophila]|uniref:Glycerophosphoryl diester phosphodiesterase n=1 Tax=Seinonella peptonophila TaxID=112248 RepID=A0A1M4SQ54_9BACL|nr:glycerophosphodiester phosphodiesterase family protein [Seinonella peptonophila]SHE34340.1 glycerophosphoryl diester phosphodiesterase [Seinonella peptonophila]